MNSMTTNNERHQLRLFHNPWRTVKTGVGFKEAADKMWSKVIQIHEVAFWDAYETTASKASAGDVAVEIDLFVVTNTELGLKGTPSNGIRRGCTEPDLVINLKETYTRALELGYDFCPDETGLLLYQQQPDVPVLKKKFNKNKDSPSDFLIITAFPIRNKEWNDCFYSQEFLFLIWNSREAYKHRIECDAKRQFWFPNTKFIFTRKTS